MFKNLKKYVSQNVNGISCQLQVEHRESDQQLYSHLEKIVFIQTMINDYFKFNQQYVFKNMATNINSFQQLYSIVIASENQMSNNDYYNEYRKLKMKNMNIHQKIQKYDKAYNRYQKKKCNHEQDKNKTVNHIRLKQPFQIELDRTVQQNISDKSESIKKMLNLKINQFNGLVQSMNFRDLSDIQASNELCQQLKDDNMISQERRKKGCFIVPKVNCVQIQHQDIQSSLIQEQYRKRTVYDIQIQNVMNYSSEKKKTNTNQLMNSNDKTVTNDNRKLGVMKVNQLTRNHISLQENLEKLQSEQKNEVLLEYLNQYIQYSQEKTEKSKYSDDFIQEQLKPCYSRNQSKNGNDELFSSRQRSFDIIKCSNKTNKLPSLSNLNQRKEQSRKKNQNSIKISQLMNERKNYSGQNQFRIVNM